MNSKNSLASRRSTHLKIDIPNSNASEISLGEIIDRYLDEAAEQNSNKAEPANSFTDNSIPAKLRRFYSHNSFKNIILAFLSITSIGLTFIGLFVGKLDGCETISFVTSVILLFAPSPLQMR